MGPGGPAPVSDLAWESAGDGAPVVLLHGFTLDRRMWDPQIPALADRFRVIRYDLRGHGASPRPSGPYRHADDLADLLDALRLDAVALVGLSLGGGIASSFAATYPDRVRALVLVESALAGVAYSPAFVAGLESVARAARDGGVRAARERWYALPLLAGSLAHPVAGPALRRILDDYDGWHWTHRDPGLPADPPTLSRLDRIRASTWIVTGEHTLHDFVRIARILRDGIAGARYDTIPAAAHLPNLESPAAFTAGLSEFLVRSTLP